MAQRLKRLPAIWETWVPSLGSGRSPGEGNGNPLQYPCLENSMDRGAWWATVAGSQRVGHDWATSLTHYLMSFPGGASSKEPACQFRRYKRQVLSLGWEPLKKGTATHSNILVWRIPWTEEPGRVTQSRTQFKWFSIPACIVQFTLKYFWQDTRINRWRERKEK